MLHYDVVMKITNEKKGIFSFYSHNMKKNSVTAISITEDLMFRLKVLTINESKDTHHINMSNCTLYIVKFFIRLMPCFGPILLIFRTRLPVYALITQLRKT